MDKDPFMHRRAFALALALTALVAGLSIWADLPGPAGDDLFYVGPALSYAQHGTLLMPLLTGQHFPTSEFLIYPAFYQYMLGAWLKVFGISTRSILAFVQMGYLVAGFAGTWLAWKLSGGLPEPRWPWPAVVMVALLVTLGTMGFRPDAWGVAVMLAGFGLGTGTSFARRFFGWVAVGCSLMIAPNMLPYAAVAAVVILAFRREGLAVAAGRELFAAGLAMLAVAGVFTLSIHGRWQEFSRALAFHASRSVLPPLAALHYGGGRYFGGFRTTPVTVVAAALCSMAIARAILAQTTGRAAGRRFLVCVGAVLAAGTLSIMEDWIRVELRLFTCILAAGGSCFWMMLDGGTAVRRWSWVGLVAVFGCAAWIRDPLEPRWLPTARPSVEHVREALACVAREPDRRFLIDPYTARSVFDYHLPPHARDWGFSLPFPGLYPDSVHANSPSETWIIAGVTLKTIEPSVCRFAPFFKFGPIRLRRMVREFDVYLIDGRLPPGAQLSLGAATGENGPRR